MIACLDFIQKQELTKDKIIWLKEVWFYVLNKNTLPSYMAIRRKTLNEINKGFKVDDIPRNLMFKTSDGIKSQLEITLEGLFHIEEENDFLEATNKLVAYVKRDLGRNDTGKYIIDVIGKKIGIDPIQLGIYFTMLNRYTHHCSSSSVDKGLFGIQKFEVESESSFDTYFKFDSVEDALEYEFRRRAENDQKILVSKSKPIFNKGKNKLVNLDSQYVDATRLDELRSINSDKFDLAKLIRLCEELGDNYTRRNYYSVALLVRAIINHVPPVFGKGTFKGIVDEYKSENNEISFRKSMIHLQGSLRNIGDSVTHSMARKSEILPNATQVDFRNDLDILLSEIVRILK